MTHTSSGATTPRRVRRGPARRRADSRRRRRVRVRVCTGSCRGAVHTRVVGVVRCAVVVVGLAPSAVVVPANVPCAAAIVAVAHRTVVRRRSAVVRPQSRDGLRPCWARGARGACKLADTCCGWSNSYTGWSSTYTDPSRCTRCTGRCRCCCGCRCSCRCGWTTTCPRRRPGRQQVQQGGGRPCRQQVVEGRRGGRAARARRWTAPCGAARGRGGR